MRYSNADTSPIVAGQQATFDQGLPALAAKIDSEGLTSLLTLQENLQELGGDVKITTTNPANRKILEITRLDQHLEVYDSVIDAVKSYM